MANTYIGIANVNGETFANTLQDDLIFYASEPARVLLGTQCNVNSKILIGSSNTIITDNTVFDNDITVKGDALMVNDLIVQGNLITKRDITLAGNQIALGASYCNGDLFVINNASNTANLNATLFLKSISGIPMVSMHQEQVPNPFMIYQSNNGDGYIVNSNNIRLTSQKQFSIGTASNIYATFSNNGFLGLGIAAPKTKLDIFDGNINAKNIIKLKKSTSNNTDVNININWSNTVVGSEYCIVLETTQQLNGKIGGIMKRGTKVQQHHLILDTPYRVEPQVSYNYGDWESYTSIKNLYSNISPTIVNIKSSLMSGTYSNILHEFDVNVLIAPQSIGHVWLS
jgi:hypothetical protein